MAELRDIVQNMINAGESEENIALVIKRYNSLKAEKDTSKTIEEETAAKDSTYSGVEDAASIAPEESVDAVQNILDIIKDTEVTEEEDAESDLLASEIVGESQVDLEEDEDEETPLFQEDSFFPSEDLLTSTQDQTVDNVKNQVQEAERIRRSTKKEQLSDARKILETRNKSLPEDQQVNITDEAVLEEAKKRSKKEINTGKQIDKLDKKVSEYGTTLFSKNAEQEEKENLAKAMKANISEEMKSNLATNKEAQARLTEIKKASEALTDTESFKTAQANLNAAKKAYDSDPSEANRSAYENAYNEYKKEVDSIRAEHENYSKAYDEQLNIYNGTINRYEELVETDEDLNAFLESYGRNNSLLWGKTFGKLAVTLGDMGVGILELEDKLRLPNLIKLGISIVEDGFGYDLGENGDALESGLTYYTEHILPKIDPTKTSIAKRREMRSFLEQARNGLAKAPRFSEVNGIGDFGNYLADLAFNQAPNLALMYYTGGASLYAMGAVSAGQKFGEYEDMIHEDGLRISPLQMYTAATLTGVTEAFSEKITLGQIGRFKTAIRSNPNLKVGVGDYLTNQLFSVSGVLQTGSDAIQEGVSEMAAQLSSNYLDNQIGIETDPLEGVSEAFWSGAVMSAFLFKAPVAGRNLYKALEGKDANQRIGEKQERLKELGRLLNSDLEPGLKSEYEAEHQQLVKDIHNIQREEISKLDKMSNREKKTILDIARKKYQLRKKASQVANSNMDPKTKQAEIDKINDKISQLDVKKNEVIAPYYLQDTVDEITIQTDAIGDATGKTAKVTQMNAEEIAESLLAEQARIRAEIEANEQYLGTDQDAVARQNIEAYKNELKALEQADNQFGYISPQEDGGFELIINKDKPMMGTAAHELMHAVLFKSIQQDPSIQDAMGDALIAHVATLGGNNSIIGRRMQAYGKWIKDKDGKDVFAREPNFGEEVITVISEGMYDGTLEYNEGFVNKIGNFVRRTLQDKLGRTVRFNTGRDVYNFIKDFDRSLKAGKINKAIIRTAAEGAKGRLLKGVKTGERFTAYSKDAFQEAEVVDDLGLKQNTANIVKTNNEIESDILVENIKDDDGNVKASTVNQQKLVRNNLPRAFALARQAAGKANDLTLDEALKMNDVMEWYSEYSLKLAELARTYKAKMKDGTRVPFGAYMNNLLPKKYTGILSKLKSKVETTTMSDEATFKKVNRTATPTTTLSNMEVEGKIVALNSIGQNAVQKQLIENVKKDKSLGKLRKYKEVKEELTKHNKFTKEGNPITDEIKAKRKKEKKKPLKELKTKRVPTGKLFENLKAVSEGIFGVDVMRILQEQDLNTEMRKSAQDVILAKTNEIIAMMPFGTTASGDATGVANTKLKIFYEKLARMTMKATGSGKGLAQQQKQNIDPTKFRALVGLIKNGRINNTSVDGAIRAVIVQVASIANNQAIRQVYGPDTLQLKDGKASTMFSKRYAEPKIQFSNDADLSKMIKVENGSWTNILKNFNHKPINMKSEEGRADLQNWVYNTMSNYLPFSFYQHSGNWQGTFKTIDKDGIPKKEWDAKRDEYSKKAYKKPWKKLTKEQKNSVKAKMKKDNLPGNVTKKAHKGNYLYKDMAGLNEGIQAFIDSGAAWNAEANLTEQQKQDIANGLKWITQNTKNLKDADFKASKLRGFELIWKQFDKMIADNPANAPYIAALLSSSSAYQGHFMRTGAMYEFENTLNEANVEEHTQAITDLAKFLFNRLMQRNLDIHLGPALNAYFQGSLPKRFDHLLQGPGFDYRADAGQYSWPVFLGIKPAWIRYFNPQVNGNNGGIDPNVIVLANGNTIAQEFGVHVDGKITPEIIAEQQKLLYRQFNEFDFTKAKATKSMKEFMKVPLAANTRVTKAYSKAINNSKLSKPTKGISVLDFDDTLATTKSRILFTRPDGTTGSLNAEEYARDYVELSEQGYEWDFSEFNEVIGGEIAPLFQKALKLQKKFGPENMFVLTARPAASQQAIYDFLKANGLNIPLKNITGLGNSTSEAKALWMVEKVAEGYNDFYFADDALQNVQAVDNILEQFDVKRKVQQARLQFSKDLNKEFNNIIEDKTGVKAEKIFSRIKAEKRGEGKGKYKFFIPPSAEDFKGLLYAFLGKGKKGDAQMAWFKKALLDPFATGYRRLNAAKQIIANEYKALRKGMPNTRKKMTKKIPEMQDYRYADAVRVYLWDKAGFTIPGLSATDQANLVEVVNNDPSLKVYADKIGLISRRPEGYIQPREDWMVTNILGDLSDATDRVGRKEFLAEWIENKNIIFSPENLNKIEATYGKDYREALEDMLYRMENGTNRTTGSDNKLVNAFMNWTNNSVGAIMFFNARSAVLQTLSTVNFINWRDNNIFKAAKAFANQPQFWKDFSMLFNSDMLKQRRKGLKTDVNHAELTEAVGRSRNPAMAALNWLLQKGFLPTQIADSFAIATGGATFYRNRVNTYLKQGLTLKEAETRAFEDFQEIAEETQQSSRPDLISQQQASALGRLILAFQNTPMQYMRLTKKAMQDLINGRGDARANISRIVYYMAVQNVIFYSLQSALFALAFDDEEDDEKKAANEEKKYSRMLNGMMDTILRGTGVYGAIASTIKNVILKLKEEEDKTWNKDFAGPLVEALNLSPPIGSKARKFVSAQKSYNYNADVIKKMNILDFDNPIWDVVGNLVSFSTNVPLDRIVNKSKNIREALDDDNATWQRIALMLGWNRWDLDIDRPESVEQIKKEIKEEKKEARKEKQKLKQEEKKKQEEEENKTIIEENKKKNDGRCAAISKGGKRCKKKAVNGGFCTVHEKKEKNASGKMTQCKKIKSDGARCKMQTSNKSGYCYYHD